MAPDDDDQDKKNDRPEEPDEMVHAGRPGTGPWVYDPTIFYGDGVFGDGPGIWETPTSVRTDVAGE